MTDRTAFTLLLIAFLVFAVPRAFRRGAWLGDTDAQIKNAEMLGETVSAAAKKRYQTVNRILYSLFRGLLMALGILLIAMLVGAI